MLQDSRHGFFYLCMALGSLIWNLRVKFVLRKTVWASLGWSQSSAAARPARVPPGGEQMNPPRVTAVIFGEDADLTRTKRRGLSSSSEGFMDSFTSVSATCRVRFRPVSDTSTRSARVCPRGLEELTQLGRTLWRKRKQVLAPFDHGGASNGPVEAVNGRLKQSQFNDRAILRRR